MDSLRTTVAAFPTVQHGVALVDLIDIPGLPGKLRARGLSDPPAELNGLFQVIIAALLTGAAHDVMTDAIRDPSKRSDGVHVLRTLQQVYASADVSSAIGIIGQVLSLDLVPTSPGIISYCGTLHAFNERLRLVNPKFAMQEQLLYLFAMARTPENWTAFRAIMQQDTGSAERFTLERFKREALSYSVGENAQHEQLTHTAHFGAIPTRTRGQCNHCGLNNHTTAECTTGPCSICDNKTDQPPHRTKECHLLARANAFQKGKGRASTVPSDGASGSRRCAYCQLSGHGTTTCPQLLLLQKNQDKLPATNAGTKSQSLSKKPRAYAAEEAPVGLDYLRPHLGAHHDVPEFAHICCPCHAAWLRRSSR